MDPSENSHHQGAFFESDMFKHLTAGLNSLLKDCRQDHHVPSAIRYHIIDIQDEKPKLGETMRFKECDNEDGSPCPEEDRCFNPNFSAENYLTKFLSDADRFVMISQPEDLSRDEFTTLLNLYSVPNHHQTFWITAFANVFRDLFGQTLE
ncbi:hypothetical protein NW752_003011 [Fusarium irregulare]|uniref:Uncharacterized protein n=1 Tax=Fusarium irregulare TaxID=2494466 RepID=A0A9W8UE29_9HYPO|nr:hypothetical protein NW766_000678 [Fusarium irregulare]KAJ4025538.1 hypothetical protein NW752_003011 [Fusarium irregulare]